MMEMRLRAMSDHVRVMRYSAPVEEAATGAAPQYDGDGGFPTDPRNAHHDGRHRRACEDGRYGGHVVGQRVLHAVAQRVRTESTTFSKH